jgi:hypothetical protein
LGCTRSRELSAPELSAPELSAPELSAPELSAPELSAPQLSAPDRPALYLVDMFWPLIGGFIAFVLLTLLIGWLVDPAHRREAPDAGARPAGPRRTRV